MPSYIYIARDNRGNILRGTCRAESRTAVSARLRQMGYRSVAVSEKARALFSEKRKRITTDDLVSFCQQFSVMYGAGLSLGACLSSLAQESASERLQKVLGDILRDVESGRSLSAAMRKHGGVFSEFFLNMIEAGETGGTLENSLRHLAAHLEKEQELRQRIRSALAYPIVILIVICVVVTFLMIFVVPVFASVYKRMNVDLPAATSALIFLSHAARYYFWVPIAAVGVLIPLCRRLGRLEPVKDFLDRLVLAVPIYGELRRKVIVQRFIRTFGAMLAAGVNILRALEIAERVAKNRVISQASEMIRTNLQKGGTITEALRFHDVFPAPVVQMFASGEESGELPELLEKAATGLERDLDHAIHRLLVKLEPALTVLLGCVVGFILIAIYLPMFDLVGKISKGEF